MTVPATIVGIATTDPEVIGGKHTGVRLSDQIRAHQQASQPAGATVSSIHDFPIVSSGGVVITGDRDGYDITLYVEVTSSIILAGGTGQILGTNAIPEAWRPRRKAFGAANIGATPGAIELDAGGTLRYLCSPGDKAGLSASISFKAQG